MKFTIIGRKITVTEKISEYIEKKLSKLDKFFRDDAEARIVIGTVKDQEYVEAAVYASGVIFRAEVTDRDVFAAADKMVDVIERQIRKNKTRLAKKLREEFAAEAPAGDEDTESFDIIKTKRFKVKPMSAEEAVLQMNLLGHSFFVFRNRDTDEMNVVYKRRDGKYAVIEACDYD